MEGYGKETENGLRRDERENEGGIENEEGGEKYKDKMMY